ncbi:MAG: LexA family protein [Citrobacter portucalensis]
MKTLSERIEKRMLDLGITPTRLAERIGKSKVTVHKLLSGTQDNVNADTLFALSRTLKCTADWLYLGIGTPEGKGILIQDSTIGMPVPLMSIRDVSGYITGEFNVDDLDRIACPIKCSAETFAAKVIGDSMSPRFEQADIIFVDQSIRDPKVESFVVYMQSGRNEATFKQYQIFDGQVYLKSLNESLPNEIRYQKAGEQDTLIGVVISHIKPV